MNCTVISQHCNNNKNDAIPIKLLMEFPDFIVGSALPKVLHDTSSDRFVATFSRIDCPGKLNRRQSLTRVLLALHFAVDDASVLAEAVDVVDLGEEGRVREGWEENVVQVDWHEGQETLATDCRHRVVGVVRVGPGVGAGCQAAVAQEVQNTLVRVILAAHEHEVFQCVR